MSFNGVERLCVFPPLPHLRPIDALHSIGDAAKNAFHQNPKNTVFDTKRLIGRTMTEPSVQRDLNHLPYTVKDKNNSPVISVRYKDEVREFVRFVFASARAGGADGGDCRPQRRSAL